MTPRQLYTAYRSLADAAGEAHLTAPRFARLYWLCAVEWLINLSLETTTERVRHLTAPYRHQAVGTGSAVGLSDVKPPVLAIRALRCDFTESDRMEQPVTPVDSDTLGERQRDPFRRGTDDDPIYCQEAAGRLDIYSDTVPAWRLSYFTFPAEVDMERGGERPEPIDAQWQILRRVVAEKDLIDEKYNRYQLLAGRVIPAGEQPA